MLLNRKVIFFQLLLICQMSSIGNASDASGSHGGGAIVCRDLQGKILSAELLDLWEGRVLKGRPLVESSENKNAVTDFIRRAITILREKEQNKMAATVERIALGIASGNEKKLNLLPSGIGILAPDDSKAVYVPKGCKIEGAGTYDDRYETFDVDAEIFYALSPLNQAALFVHEGVYKYLRETFKVKNSISARNITACLFSKFPCPELDVRNGMPETGFVMRCHAPVQMIFEGNTVRNEMIYEFFQTSFDTVRVQFTHREYDLLPTQSYIDLHIMKGRIPYSEDFEDYSKFVPDHGKFSELMKKAFLSMEVSKELGAYNFYKEFLPKKNLDDLRVAHFFSIPEHDKTMRLIRDGYAKLTPLETKEFERIYLAHDSLTYDLQKGLEFLPGWLKSSEQRHQDFALPMFIDRSPLGVRDCVMIRVE